MEQLESIRQKLGLSRRQICKLLKVDPSAWTRWMKTPNGAPPHVHQSLEWYMKLVEQNPEAHAPFLLAQKFESSNKESEIQISKLKKEVDHLRREHIDKKEVFEQLGGKIQNSFENILLKFRDHMVPLKMMEVDTLKYENKKLASTIQDLEKKMDMLFKKLSKAKTPIKVKAKTKLKIIKKKSKKKSNIKKTLRKKKSKSRRSR